MPIMQAERKSGLVSGHGYVMEHFTSLAFLVLGVCLAGFVAITHEVMEGETNRLDQGILLAMRMPEDHGDPVGPAWVEEMFRDFTALGGVGVLGLIAIACVGYLWLRGMRRVALSVVFSIAGGLLLSLALKAGFDRPRPELVSHGSMVYTSSFPSGHSMLAAIVYLTCGAFLAAAHCRRSIRVFILAYAVLLTLLVGVSRIYLGVHWPTDVLAGWSAGWAWAAASWLVARWLQEHGRIEKEVES
jgi:undecaprenyl-diphosphatase